MTMGGARSKQAMTNQRADQSPTPVTGGNLQQDETSGSKERMGQKGIGQLLTHPIRS